MQLKNAIMVQLHDHWFITFWTEHWILILRGVKGLQGGGRMCGSNILLKNKIQTNKLFLC